jgi:DNA-binding MarR family transcriptional regulator
LQIRTVRAPQADAGAFIEEIITLIRALGLQKLGQTPCRQPVSVAEAQTLLELSRTQGMSQNSLAARLGLEKSTISRLVSILEDRAWVQRARDTDDTRLVRLRLTALGARAAGRLATSRRQKFERVFRSIPRAERGAVLKALSVLTEALRRDG